MSNIKIARKKYTDQELAIMYGIHSPKIIEKNLKRQRRVNRRFLLPLAAAGVGIGGAMLAGGASEGVIPLSYGTVFGVGAGLNELFSSYVLRQADRAKKEGKYFREGAWSPLYSHRWKSKKDWLDEADRM